MINYLFSGIDKEIGFDKIQSKYLKSDIKKDMTIVFVASTFDLYERNDTQRDRILNCFNKINISFKSSFLIDSRVSVSDAKEMVQNSDIVFLLGGSPNLQMKGLNDYQLVDILKETSHIIIGVSAGSMNQGKNVIYKDEYENNKIYNYKGLGFYDINFYPHLDFDSISYMKELFDISTYAKTISLPNSSFIRICDKKIDIIGDYYIVSGVKDERCK